MVSLAESSDHGGLLAWPVGKGSGSVTAFAQADGFFSIDRLDAGAEEAGHGVTRTEIAWNDFIIVGPAWDPARINGTHDATLAFKAIWNAQAPFISRGDKSVTDAKEKRPGSACSILWQTRNPKLDTHEFPPVKRYLLAAAGRLRTARRPAVVLPDKTKS